MPMVAPCRVMATGAFEFQIAGQVLPKLPNSDFRSLHSLHPRCVHDDTQTSFASPSGQRLGSGVKWNSILCGHENTHTTPFPLHDLLRADLPTCRIESESSP